MLLRAVDVLLWLLLAIQSSMAIRWLGIRYDSNRDWSTGDCNRKQGFIGSQYKICRRNLRIMRYVTEAVEMTREECVTQMQERRWNCSSIVKAPRFMNDLKRGTKESAFVYSLSAAAVAYAVTQACSTGRLESICTCGRTPKLRLKRKGHWKWGGCSDNIAYGSRFAKTFTQAKNKHRMIVTNKRRFEQGLMNLHNSDVGIAAVREKMEVICRCHGVSGGCQTKTCFRRLGEFRKVAAYLRKRFDRIVYVKGGQSKNRKNKKDVVSREKRINLRSKNNRPYTRKDLIALQRSPNYCRKNTGKGSYGTKGRICNPHRRGKGGCSYMCCGRGHRTKSVRKVERCKCKYVWCCYVKCSTCTKWLDVSRCK